MYVPKHFSLDDSAAWTIVRATRVGTLVVVSPSGMRSVFVPVLADEGRLELRGHVARANPWWKDVADGSDVLGVFNAASAYISPSYYPTRFREPAVVPTWDYLVVEIHGTVVVHDDPEWTEGVARELSDTMEMSRPEPWRVDDSPAEYVAALARRIVGFQISVTSVTGAAKLSQNKDGLDRDNVIDALSRGTDVERTLSRLMVEMS